MTNKLILFLALTACAWSQPTMPFAYWKSAAAASWTPAAFGDSLKLWTVSRDVADSLGKAGGDTTWMLPNRARFNPYALPHPINTTWSEKPIYGADSAVVVFDGVEDFMRCGVPVRYAQPVTVSMVARFYKPQDPAFVWWDSHAGGGRIAIYNTNTVKPRLFAGGDGVQIGHWLSSDTVYVVTAVYNGASSVLRINGQDYTGTSGGTGSLIGITIGASFAVGADSGPFGLREMVVVHSALDATDRARLDTYFRSKYSP